MAADIKVPPLGESVTTATVARWLKKAGEQVAADEALVELETDKVTVEVNAPSAGTLGPLVADEGAEVEVGALLGTIEQGGAAAAPPKPPRRADIRRQAAAAGSRPGLPSGHPARRCRGSPSAHAGCRQADGGERHLRRAGGCRVRQGWPDHQG